LFGLLNNLEASVSELKTAKKQRLELCIKQKKAMEEDSQTFIAEQTSRIDQLKKYLDERLHTAILDY